MLKIIEENNINEICISSREIAELANKRHSHCLRDIREQMKGDESKFGSIYLDKYNREKHEYLLPRNIAMGIASGYSFDLRMKIINRLDELENKQNKPLTYEETMQNALLLADSKVKELEHKIINDKPLVSYAKSVETSINSVLIRDWCKSIGIREKDARLWFLEKGYLYKDVKGKWNLKATDTAKKYFEAVPTTQSTSKGTFVNYTIKIRGEGQTALTEKILNYFKNI